MPPNKPPNPPPSGTPRTDHPRSLAGLSLRDLEYAQAVAALRHFGRAAERCGVSQPALSEQIRKLEAILGTPLFERTKRRVAPTPTGEALLAQIERVMLEARHLLTLSHGPHNGVSGDIALGAIETLGPYYLPGLLRLLRIERPDLSLRLTEGRTARLVDRLLDGSLDLLLLALPVPRPGLIAAPLFFERFLLATPPGHALASLPMLSLDELPADDLLLLEEGHCLRDQALSLCDAKPVTRHATSLETLWQMIAAGEGYSLLPALAVAARPELQELILCRPLNDAAAGREIGLVWRRSDPRTPSFRTLAALLAAQRPAATDSAPTALPDSANRSPERRQPRR
ncbi:MAG TPA: hydrogen peroxide-inducible genes activator [Acidiphilium sp.]|nr:MAG: LysR family transcriptional regulator [Acidiphilium sp. 21-60-14]OYV90330.1 MAG: LysR family transcriptional regulator [Acidiphilium sp. 37-60-79]OZB41556.1 MAG: LysR family transcriptional regulator [Acidiphilium sp. 34-60-192]HQT88986.1 hydrogen peroxide-inducible genes activator [Acidiphilium sp.]HQU24003.1 hydrogen peroxide-inducible genes activator [Acidiphilium sp.]